MIYLVIISLLLDFHITLLFEGKTFLLVIVGTILLSVSGVKKGMKREQIFNTIGYSAILSSFIITLVFMFEGASSIGTDDYKSVIAIGCRPLLYGVVFYSIFHMQKQKDSIHSQTDTKQEDTHERRVEDLQTKGLTKREIEIAGLIRRGLTNREIAEELFIAETTVKKHVSNIFEKLDIQKREEI